MMEVFQAVVLGAVQGLTEFLPVSSSGHLIIFPALFGWSDQGLAFDALVHFGTFVALVWYFRKDLKRLTRDVFSGKKQAIDFVLRIGAATLPALVLALLLSDLVETYLRSTLVVTVSLIVWGVALFIADRYSGKQKQKLDQYEAVSWKQALVIGFAQPIALIPGTSRSGITITAGLFSGLSRKAAAQFSFFLAIPITGLAGLYGIWQSLSEQATNSALFHVSGFFSAALFGIFAIHLLLSYVKKQRYDIFVYYRLLLALFLIAFIRVA